MRGEEKFRLPGRFATVRLARRDRGPVTAPVRAPSNDLLVSTEARIRALLAHAETPEAARRAATAQLDGRDHTAFGAGVLLAALDWVIGWDETTAGVVDAWIEAHGLAFAAAAAAESGAWEVRGVWLAEATTAYPVGRLSRAQIRVREAIAAAPDCAEAEAALAELRAAGPWQRLAASFMAPHRRDWVDEDCAEPRDGTVEALAASIGTAEQLRVLRPRLDQAAIWRDPRLLATFVDGLREAAAAPLADWYDREREDRGRTVHRNLLTALAAIPGDDAFRLLAARAERPDVASVLAKLAARVPRRALRLLAVEGMGLQAMALLRDRVEADPALAAEVAATLPEEFADLLRPAPVGEDVLPPLVLSTAASASTSTEEVSWGPVSGVAETGESWLPGEREVWLSLAPVEIDRSYLDGWEPPRGARSDLEQAVVARFGLQALPMALRLAAQQPDVMGVLLLPFEGPRVATVIAGWLEHTGSARFWARLWLGRHAESAARALVPIAAGKPGAERDRARRALRHLDRQAALPTEAGRDGVPSVRPGGEQPASGGLSAEAGQHGVPSVRPRGDGDPPSASAGAGPLAVPSRPVRETLPTMPLWATHETLPPIYMRDGRGQLPPASVTTLLAALSLTRYADLPAHAPGGYDPSTGRADVVESAFAPQPLIALDTGGAPVIAAARELCEANSLAAFGGILLAKWVDAKMPASDAWILLAQVHLADDEAIRNLAALIRPWPGRGRHVRAGDAVAVLGTLAVRAPGAALWELDRLTAEPAQSLRERATAYLRTAAAAHGWTPEQIPHRAAPSFARIELDYGPRRITAGVGERLEAYVLDPDGRPVRTLPRPTKRDDEVAVAIAREQFAQLRRELRPEAARQSKRLEQAMISGVRWPAAELTGFLTGHALFGPFARRLLWGSYTPDGHALNIVRVCEDGTLADVDDHPVALDPGAPIGVAHPADLGADLPRWAALLADYGIGQPFAQLTRLRFPLTPEERGAAVLSRPAEAAINPSRLGPFMRRGWRSSPAGFGRFLRDIPGGLALTVGVQDGRLTMWADERDTLHWGRAPRIPLGALPAATVEEAIRDLTTITAAP
ncbi:DUF4132 domain-containing protein [Catenuloplanes japonicus]|uniref:DUF4132 domain-containing protein n=1 Tax=Catenuloplanes japonicus TaxID=33876 RepID=UPI00068C461C|nr:DUF4132 domain-containing protein [Catenuloplanes japonicus]